MSPLALDHVFRKDFLFRTDTVDVEAHNGWMMPVSGLRACIEASLRRDGWDVVVRDDVLLATRELIRSRWLLGSRRVALGVQCHFDEAGRVLHYHEIAKDGAGRVRQTHAETADRCTAREEGL